eukprot:366524-Chlamydomonas_euryale.AAC.3
MQLQKHPRLRNILNQRKDACQNQLASPTRGPRLLTWAKAADLGRPPPPAQVGSLSGRSTPRQTPRQAGDAQAGDAQAASPGVRRRALAVQCVRCEVCGTSNLRVWTVVLLSKRRQSRTRLVAG